MDRFAMFVGAGAPGVIPQAAPIGLFLETDDFGDLGPLRAADWKARSWARPEGPAPMTATRCDISISPTFGLDQFSIPIHLV